MNEIIKRRTVQSLRFKIDVLNYFHAHQPPNKTQTARHFQITRKQVRSFLKIENFIRNASDKRQKRIIVVNRPPKYPDQELLVLNWFKEERAAKIAVSGKNIQLKMVLCVNENNPCSTFRASAGWLQNFLRRHRLTRRRITTSGRPLPSDAIDVIEEHLENVNVLIEKYNFSPEQVLGMDESSHYMDEPGSYTYDSTNSQRVEVATTGMDKTRVSSAYTASSGGNKLNILTVIPRANALNNVMIPDNIVPVYLTNGCIFLRKTYNF